MQIFLITSLVLNGEQGSLPFISICFVYMYTFALNLMPSYSVCIYKVSIVYLHRGLIQRLSIRRNLYVDYSIPFFLVYNVIEYTRAVYKNYIHKQGSPYRHKKKGGGGSFCFYFLFRYLCLFFLLYQFILLEKNNDNVTGRTGPLGSLCIGCLFFGGRVSDVMKLELFILFFIWNMWFYTMNLKDRREKMLWIKYSCEMHKKSFSILKLEKKRIHGWLISNLEKCVRWPWSLQAMRIYHWRHFYSSVAYIQSYREQCRSIMFAWIFLDFSNSHRIVQLISWCPLSSMHTHTVYINLYFYQTIYYISIYIIIWIYMQRRVCRHWRFLLCAHRYTNIMLRVSTVCCCCCCVYVSIIWCGYGLCFQDRAVAFSSRIAIGSVHRIVLLIYLCAWCV